MIALFPWILALSPVILVLLYLVSVPELFETGLVLSIVFVLLTGIAFAIIFPSISHITIPSDVPSPAAEAVLERVTSDVLEKTSDIVECTAVLRSAKKILIKLSSSPDTGNEFSSPSMLASRLVALMESCPFEEDDRFFAALDLLATLLSASNPQCDLLQGAETFSFLKRVVAVFKEVDVYLQSPDGKYSDRSDRFRFLVVRVLTTLVSLDLKLRDFLGQIGSLQLAMDIGMKPDLLVEERVILWASMFLSTMTADHVANVAEVYHSGGLTITAAILQRNYKHRDIVYHNLLILHNILTCPNSKHSVSQAKQQCLMMNMCDIVANAESEHSNDPRIAGLSSTVQRCIFGNFS